MVNSPGRPTENEGDILRRAKAVAELRDVLRVSVDDVAPPVSDMLGLLIYDILNQKTVATTARTVFAALVGRFPTWTELLAASAEDIEEVIHADGLAHRRAARIQQLITRIVADFPDGTFETLNDWEDSAIRSYLTGLPAVGDPTAQHVLLYAFGRPILPLTWTLKRLFTRLGIIDHTARSEEIFVLAAALLPRGSHRTLFEQLTAVARLYCRPRAPRCRQCPLTANCTYYRRHHGPRLLTNPHARRRPGRPAAKRPTA